MGVHAGGTQTSNDLSVETHTIRAPASQSLGNFLMTPSPAAAGDGGITNPLCQSCTSIVCSIRSVLPPFRNIGRDRCGLYHSLHCITAS
jgi:hypothetical protein